MDRIAIVMVAFAVTLIAAALGGIIYYSYGMRQLRTSSSNSGLSIPSLSSNSNSNTPPDNVSSNNDNDGHIHKRLIDSVGEDLDEACPVVLGSLPKRVRNANANDVGRLVCLQVGKYQDTMKTIPFRPKYIRVAQGYSFAAYTNPYFGEPIQYNMVGPMERIIDVESWALEIGSAVVYLTVNLTPDTKTCNAVLRLQDGDELCLQEGVQAKFPYGTPAQAELQPGYRLVAFPEPNLGGAASVAELVGPVRREFSQPLSSSSSSKANAQQQQREWASLRVSRCAMSLYSDTSFRGRAKCFDASVPALMWQPLSIVIAKGYTLQAYSQPDYNGKVLFVATGPRQFNVSMSALAEADSLRNSQPKDEKQLPWGSIRLTQLMGNDHGKFVTLYASKVEESGPAADTRMVQLQAGDYKSIEATIGFQPLRASVPQGLVLKAYDRDGKLAMEQAGQWTGSVKPSPAWSFIAVK
jgi:hypothetical protein